MTTDPRNLKDEKTLEQDIESIRAAWAEQEQIDPPELLNTAVLNQAKRELENRKGTGKKWFSPRGLGAFATAAVVVVAFTLVVQQQGNAPIPVASEMDGIKLDRDDTPAAPSNRSLKAESESALREKPSQADLQDTAARAATPAMKKRTAPIAEESVLTSPPAPETWIQDLLALKESGDATLASELAAFRDTYPDYPLPPELDE